MRRSNPLLDRVFATLAASVPGRLVPILSRPRIVGE